MLKLKTKQTKAWKKNNTDYIYLSIVVRKPASRTTQSI